MNRTGPSQSDLAAGLNVSQPMVSKLKTKGMPTHSVAAAVAWRAQNLNQAHQRGSSAKPRETNNGNVDVESFNDARRRREIAEANQAEMKYAELQGVLVRRDRVRAIWERKYATNREAMLQIPSRLAAQMAAVTDQAKAFELMDAEIRATLEHLTGGPRDL